MTTLARKTRTRRRPAVAAGTVALLVAGITGAAVPAAHATSPAVDTATTAAIYGSASPQYDGAYRQSLAILGLHAAGLTPAPSAVRWLLNQQCADGGFVALDLTPGVPCTPADEDSNSTALAAQALQAVGDTTAATKAVDHLVSIQQADGGWEYSPGDGSDANSTGLVLMALSAADVAPTHDAATYLAAQQIGQGVTALQSADDGAISPSWAGGAPNLQATDQAVPGIAGANLVNVPSPTTWAADATAYATAPSVTDANVAGWGSTWLASQVDGSAVSGGDLAWTVLSLASTATAKTEAAEAYAALRADVLDYGTSASALGQAALAAKALGDTDDVAAFGTLIQETLTSAPQASYTLSSNAVWSTRSVTVHRTALTGSASDITQTVAWGDGTSTSALASTTSTFIHVYTTASTANRKVTVSLIGTNADQSAATLGTVTVTKDKVKPSADLTTPSKAHDVASWHTLHGTSSDTGLGVATVTLHLTEKRGGSWYAYDGKAWTKESSSAKASAAAKRITVKVATSGDWSLKIAKLTKGSLKVAYYATDKAGNTSATKSTTATLTK